MILNVLFLFRSLLFWLFLTSGIAFIWPVEQVGFDPFVSRPWLLWSLIVATMFSLGTLVRRDELRPLLDRPWWVVLGVATQIVVMPAAAWLITRIVPLHDELAAGVILVGCVPGAMASNVLTGTAGGSVAYSVSLTTTATLLSPISVPTVLWIVSGAQADHSLAKPAVLLACLVVLPTIIGYVVAQRSTRVLELARRFSSIIASIALLWIIATVVAGNREKLLGVGAVLLAALLVINVIGYAAGFSVGRLARLPDRYSRALTLEVGMQNAGLGTALATSLYGAATIATIPTAAYTFGCMLTGTVLAVFWRRNGSTPRLGQGGNEDV
jgi:BASS family bile acid:Na+ symporter